MEKVDTRNIEYKGKIHKNIRKLYESVNKAEGLTENTFRKRLHRELKRGVLTKEEAIDKALGRKLTRQSMPISYKGKEYSSIYKMFESVEGKDAYLDYQTLLERIKRASFELRLTPIDLNDEIITEALTTKTRKKRA